MQDQIFLAGQKGSGPQRQLSYSVDAWRRFHLMLIDYSPTIRSRGEKKHPGNDFAEKRESA
jgi:hypothetical protein